MALPLLSLRTATLSAPLGAFEVRVQIVLDTEERVARLEVLDYRSFSAAQRVHVQHLARWVLLAGGWNASQARTPLPGADEWGWTWTTDHARFSRRSARLQVANNTPGPVDSWYEILRYKQERVAPGDPRQLLVYTFLAYPPLA